MHVAVGIPGDRNESMNAKSDRDGSYLISRISRWSSLLTISCGSRIESCIHHTRNPKRLPPAALREAEGCVNGGVMGQGFTIARQAKGIKCVREMGVDQFLRRAANTVSAIASWRSCVVRTRYFSPTATTFGIGMTRVGF